MGSKPIFPQFDKPISGKLSTMSDGGVPPASPSAQDAEMLFQDAVFLVGGYARYKCPFVWVRSNHTKLIDSINSSNISTSKDTPLELKSTNTWKTENIYLWNIVEELIQNTLQPPPKNPFKVDIHKIESMPLVDRTLNAMALTNFLRKVYAQNVPYKEEVLQDIETLIDIHFAGLPFLVHQKVQT